MEKRHNVDFSKMPYRQWFFEGETMTSPEWKQSGKPFQVNKATKKAFIANLEKPERHSRLRTIGKILGFAWHLVMDPIHGGGGYEETREDREEDSEFDGVLGIGGGDALFPPEFEDGEDE